MVVDDLSFGINVNNREPLIVPEYDVGDLLDMAEQVEELGFDSVWVGDCLFSKPRWEALQLLSAISQRTNRVKLGTACLVTGTRHPLYTFLEWATLDKISGGRTILGPCMGNPKEGVADEYTAMGLEFRKRAKIFEEGLAVLRELLTDGSVDFSGDHYSFEDISFFSGTEIEPLQPIQRPPPMWVVSNPRLVTGKKSENKSQQVISRASRRIATYGDGWMTCCRAQHPDEFSEQYEQIRTAATDIGRDPDEFSTSYQVTMNIDETKQQAEQNIHDYITQYYPALSGDLDLANWGPVGTPDDIAEWIETFADAGVDHFIVRFGSADQFGQLQTFADEVLPRFT